MSITIYPTSPKEVLAEKFVGNSIRDVSTPAAIMDIAVARRNCERMLSACKVLGLSWRAHVKTHKTVELTRLQVGHDIDTPVNIVVSTLAELEFLLPLLSDYRTQGRAINVLYGIPVSPGSIPRLTHVAEQLGKGSISVLIDDPAQINVLDSFYKLSGVVPEAHIKVDMGGKRAGVVTESDRFFELMHAALKAHESGSIVLSGLYSHAGHSYGGSDSASAIKMLNKELSALLSGADSIIKKAEKRVSSLPSLILSAGASPTALSIQNLLLSTTETFSENTPELQAEASLLTQLFAAIKERGFIAEIHAGVYPTLDLQQLAAHSISSSTQSWKDIALTLIAEVHSFYPGRGTNTYPEALIGAGGLALGREPCKAYSGMAMLTPWGRPGVKMPNCEVEDYQGWIVGRFAQEHGILTWASGNGKAEMELEPDKLEVGQKVRLWPNHACITSSHFGWYFVVDSDNVGKEDEIVDIWIKARGW